MAAINVDWMQGGLSIAQRCYGQTGQGVREEGCELPVDAERVPSDQSESFVRLFAEPTERAGPPRHVVVRRASVVTILVAKVRLVWDDQGDIVDVGVGWTHTQEDFLAIGLPESG